MAKPTTEQRFWSKVRKSETGCWEWTSSLKPSGYGELWRTGGGNHAAHRFSWEQHFGLIPTGMSVCHKCDNRACVRPDHLFLGSVQDNSDDMKAKGRQNRGERVNHAKLTETQVTEIRGLRAEGLTLQALGRRFGVAYQTINLAVARRTWRHVP